MDGDGDAIACESLTGAPAVLPPTPTPMPTPTPISSTRTFSVNTTSDAADASPGDGVCETAEGQCTLRAAVEEANELEGETEVTLLAEEYGLTLGEIAVNATVTITGEAGTTIDGGRVEGDVSRGRRLFHVMPDGDLGLGVMTLQNGARYDSAQSGVLHGGGAIVNEGKLTIESVLIRDSYADVRGGLILNLGEMILTDVTLSGGWTFYIGGAGIYNEEGAEATITRARIEDNECSRSSSGGGIFNAGVMSIVETTLQDNFSVNGSNIRNGVSGRLTIRGSILVGGGNPGEGPGGISNDGEMVDEGGNSFGP
ncbi:MAG: CSLREA domain-containing protein [SAR202 cluster bacterium]|nr:CSLREA domain-containing protein [SAR202 cluster bacterium]